jgi:hypothetical protein
MQVDPPGPGGDAAERTAPGSSSSASVATLVWDREGVAQRVVQVPGDAQPFLLDPSPVPLENTIQRGNAVGESIARSPRDHHVTIVQ